MKTHVWAVVPQEEPSMYDEQDKYMYHNIQGNDLDPQKNKPIDRKRGLHIIPQQEQYMYDRMIHPQQEKSLYDKIMSPLYDSMMHPQQDKPMYDRIQGTPVSRAYAKNTVPEETRAQMNPEYDRYQQQCRVNDNTCRQCETVFKNIDPQATILPGVGLPSQNDGVCTIMHGMGRGSTNLKINGLESKSPLANKALFSTECSNGHTLNLYKMMLPEKLSHQPGQPSAAQQYASELNKMGLSVAGSHQHWRSSDPCVAAIHHQNVDMHPVEFAQKTVRALSNFKNKT